MHFTVYNAYFVHISLFGSPKPNILENMHFLVECPQSKNMHFTV